ncbi:MAG: alpha/beta fold hydrolase, partial [Myxococcales bacterium]
MRYYTERILRTPDGAALWYSITGEGDTTLVFNDGLGCDGFAWKHLCRLLGDSHRMIRWHYRGHGRSGLPQDTRRIGLDYFAEDLELVLQHAGVERGVFIGHSMGVQVGFEFYKRHPERVQALIPICGSYGRLLDTFHGSDSAAKVFPYVQALVERFPDVARSLTRTLLPTELSFQVAKIVEVNRYLIRR